MPTYKGIQGYTVQKLSEDPTSLGEVVGQLWYNSGTGKFKVAVAAAASWSAGGNMNTTSRNRGGGGTLTAGIVFGGFPYTTNVEEYNGSTWTAKTALAVARQGICGVGQTNSAILAVGGYNAPPTGFYAGNESWDGTAWTEIANILTGRKTMGGAGTNIAGLIFGGADVAANTDVTEKWDGTSWTEVGDLNTPRFEAGMSGTVDLAVIYGGGSPGVTANTETWDGTSWTETTNLSTARKAMGTTSQSSTLAFAAGGNTGSVTAVTENWDGAPVTAKTVTVS